MNTDQIHSNYHDKLQNDSTQSDADYTHNKGGDGALCKQEEELSVRSDSEETSTQHRNPNTDEETKANSEEDSP